MTQTDRAGASHRWPTGTEYAAAVQQPSTSFADPELQGGQLTLTPLGIPASASGQNAIAFHMHAATRPVAVRCLLSEHDDGRSRYRSLHDYVETHDVPAVVAAKWLDEGVRAHGRWWPVVVMPWVSGDPMHVAIEDRLGQPHRLADLADRWLDLVETLQAKRFAHGDYQHGNVLITEVDEFRLVDLDGIWVPDMGVGPPNEYGHPNYQHINRSDTDWGPNVDTFSALVIALSLLALASDPSLARFMTGENLLFTKPDFEAPGSAEIWRLLAASPDAEVADLAARLHALALAGRPPSISVREVLDASFDPASVIEQAQHDDTPTSGRLPITSSASGAAWWGDDSAPPAVAAQPAAPGAPGSIDHRPAQGGAVSQGATSGAVHPAAADAPTTSGLARVTGQPVIAGLISGAVAGLVGSLLAGVVQNAVGDERLDGGLFVGIIAGMLGGMVYAWPALNLPNYGLALRRFVVGAGVGLLAGVVAVIIADSLSRATLDIGDTENPVLVAYVWALTAGLVGLAIGLLHSLKAAAFAFTGGAVAGFAGGIVHGATAATFDRRALQVDGFDGQVLLIATFVAMLIGVLVSLAIRTARHGSLTVVHGLGQGTVIDFHSNRVTIGGSNRDTLVIRQRDLPSRAVQLAVGATYANASTHVAVLVDGVPQPQQFALASGHVLAVAGVFIRFDIRSAGASGAQS